MNIRELFQRPLAALPAKRTKQINHTFIISKYYFFRHLFISPFFRCSLILSYHISQKVEALVKPVRFAGSDADIPRLSPREKRGKVLDKGEWLGYGEIPFHGHHELAQFVKAGGVGAALGRD
ncbi:MAG: hypothetical protein A2X96_12710 [Syntrophobacterales bacterium GWC2_56_13]|nr:MAG: hypothetical protein A2X96_12710 [Syntrophobacterales bacterium GWC2_56_13]